MVAKRICVTSDQPIGRLLESVRSRAGVLGVLGWVRLLDCGVLSIHAEGTNQSTADLTAWVHSLPEIRISSEESVKVEGHEQFAIRGVSAGVFVVQEHQATAHHFDFRLEVDGVMRSWAIPKGPSLDPSIKRMALQVEDHGMAHNEFEGRTGAGAVIIWDRGTYEQGGRVAWPEALERGHAVFVLHGQKLSGGFALQRTHAGHKPQWLLIKRRDEDARPGVDIVIERPESVSSGVTLSALLEGSRGGGGG